MSNVDENGGGESENEEGDEEPETPAEAEEDLVRTCLMRGLPS